MAMRGASTVAAFAAACCCVACGGRLGPTEATLPADAGLLPVVDAGEPEPEAGAPDSAFEAGPPQPVLLASGQAQPYAIAVDGADVYWTNVGDPGQSYHDGSIARVSKAGGAVAVMASAQNAPTSLAVDTGGIYWTDQGYEPSGSPTGIFMVPSSGGATKALVMGEREPTSIALADGDVYWADFADGNAGPGFIRAIDARRAPKTLESGLPTPTAIAIDAAFVYWTALDGSVRRVPRAGGAAETLAAGNMANLRAWDVAVSGGEVYWAVTANGAGATPGFAGIMKVSTGGGTPVLLATSPWYPWWIALDETYVYWTDAGQPGQDDGVVLRAPRAGGPAKVLVVHQRSPAGIAVDDTSIYWTEELGGRVWKLAKA
jgi:hypothetical protein